MVGDTKNSPGTLSRAETWYDNGIVSSPYDPEPPTLACSMISDLKLYDYLLCKSLLCEQDKKCLAVIYSYLIERATNMF